MDESRFPAECFEAHRGHLRAVAYQMLGSAGEADAAVQEAWSRLDGGGGANLRAWLTTVVAGVCLDMLRARCGTLPAPGDTRQDALLADSVGLALLVVLDALPPAERLAFVLHDLFGLPFEEVAPVAGCTPAAARRFAARARRRLRGGPAPAAGPVRLTAPGHRAPAPRGG
ncbi:sigma-70 family RNA polymerase sigma factor [Actinomadura macrotermitis]|uniref:ECF RNA polymerase sigma factor SigJ n=1 Tax=Actinomadura macrotermitis TaxID=2585200 RepID=A0A7K0C3W2_9ACTN|nr:sigma-70 family RNA polymerase sigma factor [Actinomadura macrotermitis]MQY08125.1 ECF RNA polymerase sigma factor SigJ [Actinomadura macrotermitis]